MQAGEATISLGRSPSVHARRQGRSTIAILFAAVGVLLGGNVFMGLALYFSSDINRLFRDDSSALITAYEQRITQLRLEVDRLHSRQYAQMGDMNLQMHDLVQQQEVLFEQQEYVRALTDMAREMGIASGVQPMTVGDIPLSRPPVVEDAATLAESLSAMQEETRLALVSLSDAAVLSTGEILNELRPIGLGGDVPASAIGGPFIPADTTTGSIIEEANAVAGALARYHAARTTLLSAPVQTPIAGHPNISSNFGNRTDPFLKRPAFHAGMDFRASTGTPVLAAANGTVVFAGNNGGYGMMVDIDHGNGFITRYAHMSQITVAQGQTIDGGGTIGLAGSTGRSTGPHLHFEVRREGSALDPARFIQAGRNLDRYF